MIKLSVIVPVYNVEKYIEVCIRSILNQTLKEMEIIIIDDGSPDNSISIVEMIEDDRIKIIRQKNKGLSAARNSGLSIATGEYVTFVDSDDYLAFDYAYEQMYNLAKKENSDIVAGNCIWYYSEENNHPMKRDKNRFSSSPMIAENFFIECLKSNRVYAPVWMNIYKRSIIVDNDLYFKEGIYHEDEDFTPRILLVSNYVSIYDKEFYIYRQRSGSIINDIGNLKKCIDMLNTCLELDKLCENIRNVELKYVFKRYITIVALELIYKYKYQQVSYNLKLMISKNSNTKKLKIRSKALNLNVNLYIRIEQCIRFAKKIIHLG